MPKIVHVITGLGNGGAERSLFNLSQATPELDHHVISLSDKGHYGDRLRAIGVPVHVVDVKAQGIRSAVADLRSHVARLAPSVVQGWMYHGNIAASVAQVFQKSRPALAWNVRHCLYDLGDEKRGTQSVIRLARSVSTRPRGIVYNSHLSRHQHEDYGFRAQGGQVIPNGFDTERWRRDMGARSALRATFGLGQGDFLLGFVARYDRKKDLPNLLQALQPMMRVHPHLHVLIVGRNNDRLNPELTPHYAPLDMRRVHIVGQRDDLPQLFAAMDGFCLSSYSEAFPNVVGEAMAAGLPCVVTDVGDCAKVVGTTGIVVPPANPQALERGLTEMLLMSPEKRTTLGAHSRRRIQCDFSLTSTLDSYRALYARLTGTLA